MSGSGNKDEINIRNAIMAARRVARLSRAKNYSAVKVDDAIGHMSRLLKKVRLRGVLR